MQTENNAVAAHREAECECVWVEKCNVKHAVQMYVRKVRKQHLLIYGITYDTLALHNYCCSCLFFVRTGKHQFPPQEKKKVSITGCMDL